MVGYSGIPDTHTILPLGFVNVHHWKFFFSPTGYSTMAYLTPDNVSDIFSRTLIRPPREIVMPLNLRLVTGDGAYKGRMVLGLHRTGDDRIFLPATSPQRTLLHEAVHNMGISGETPTRVLAEIANIRMNFGILPRLFRRKISYSVEEVSPDEIAEYMKHYGITGDPSGVKMVRMILEGT